MASGEKNTVEIIEKAFKGVPKGRVGLREARAIDDRIDETDPKALLKIRASDVESDWKQITDDLLLATPHVFSYFDSDGLKFVIPAVLTWYYANSKKYHEVPEYLFYTLLPNSKSKSIETLIADLKLTPDQIRIIYNWLCDYIDSTNADENQLSMYERSNLEKWKSLV